MLSSCPPFFPQAGASTYVVIGKLGVGAAVQQQPHNVRLAVVGCRHQRRPPALLASEAPEHKASAHAPPRNRRRGTYIVPVLIRGHAVVQQLPHVVHPAIEGRVEQLPPRHDHWIQCCRSPTDGQTWEADTCKCKISPSSVSCVKCLPLLLFFLFFLFLFFFLFFFIITTTTIK